MSTSKLQYLDHNNEDLSEEEQCCGNGCVHCVLDCPSPAKTIDKETLHGKHILSEYRKCELVQKQPHSIDLIDEVVELHFRVRCPQIKDQNNGEENAVNKFILDIPAGHHVMLRIPLSSNKSTNRAKFYLRPYSPFEVDAIRMEFKILVNLKPQGQMSRFIAKLNDANNSDGSDFQEIHDFAEFYGPLGIYNHKPSGIIDTLPRGLFLITQGVAVAPAIRIIEQILQNEDDMTRIMHFACFTDLRHLYFRERLHQFRSYWNYNCRIYMKHQAHCKIVHCTQVKDCEHFRQSLKYKELLLLQQLDAADIYDICTSTVYESTKKVFVLSGSRLFQDNMSAEIHKFDFPKEIHLL